MTTWAALLGIGVGLGVLLLVTGWHAPAPDRAARSSRRAREHRGPTVRRAVPAVGVALAGSVLTGWVVGGVLAGLACYALPRLLGRDPDHQRRVARVEGIATWTEQLRDTLSAAAGLEQAILATADLAPVAIRPQIAALTARLRAGERLAPALRHLAGDLADPTADLVIAALISASQQQARRLADLLGSLALAAREQVSMRLRIDAGRARTRTSIRVIVGTTLAFAIGLVVLNRDYLTAYDTTTGQLVLLGVGGLFGAGFAWLARIATVIEPARVLTATADHTRSEHGVLS
ncbi:type II secretion system F family protein [Actinoalloteichus sp. GBA129-24]|uniref:type II secretion system F family protein n=1 Tax=Actinoalloteichus sp. GBA129-24 TaxID=1612551 RepID=UPI000950829A|nr:type II secretion system F family protein [Actinoalloteichus sp. GBA129-24]APU21316.1 Flp pilus assembly protein TadB [Actinoalloteichus sp. GBA129-24]